MQNEGDEAPDELDYKSQLLEILRKLPPAGFERLCQLLLRESGFEDVKITGRSGDQGIDGIGVVRVNPFVALKIVFQCKRYSDTVGSAEVRDFRGAMQGRADKGVIIATSTFSAEARKEAIRDGVPPIELIDGERLAELFRDYKLGVEVRTTYAIKSDFFEQYSR